MKKVVFSLIIFTLFGFQQVRADVPPVDPAYWIVGEVSGSVNPNGRKVVFYKDDATYDTNNVQVVVEDGKFMLNAFHIWTQDNPLVPEVGQTYKLAIVKGDDGYGAGPVDITITGYGYEEISPRGSISINDIAQFDNAQAIWDALVKAGIIDENGNILKDVTKADLVAAFDGLGLSDSDVNKILEILQGAESGLVLEEGQGPDTPPPPPRDRDGEQLQEGAPSLKIWFGNRLFQPRLAERGETFIVSAQPVIKLTFSIDEPYRLAPDIADYSIDIDKGSADARSLKLQSQHMVQRVYAAGTSAQQGELQSTTIQYEVAEPLTDGEHTFSFSAKSSGKLGTAGVGTMTATVEVMGGVGRLMGTPITFPSPFSISKQGMVTIQYKLSRDMAIQLFMVDITGKRVKNFVLESGQDGGSAGINKVTWDGQTDRGMLAANGIYVITIIARDEARRLGTIKLTVVD